MADRFHADERHRIQALGKTGVRADDHPLIVQFAANDPRDFAEAALAAQQLGADAVDLNLGCPQTRAKEGHYGAYLTDPHDHALCAEIIAAAADHPEISIPITVKIRLQPTTEQTVAFANLLADAGASLVAVHGRRRGTEEKHQSEHKRQLWYHSLKFKTVSSLARRGAVPSVSAHGPRVCELNRRLFRLYN